MSPTPAGGRWVNGDGGRLHKGALSQLHGVGRGLTSLCPLDPATHPPHLLGPFLLLEHTGCPIHPGGPQPCPHLLPQWVEVLFSHSVVSRSLRPHGLQHARLPCPSPSPGACSTSCPLSRGCRPTVSSSIACFSSCPQTFPEAQIQVHPELEAVTFFRIRVFAEII